MAKIQRNTQKIFGGNAPSDDIAALGSFKIGTPVYTDSIQALQNQAFEQGYGASLVANEAPFLEEQNSVPYVLSKQLAYNFQEGIPEYDVNTTYYIGSIVKTLNEENKPVLYYSIIDDNVGNEVTNAEAWEELTFTQDIPTGLGGFNLFDLIYSDHILEGDEAVGKALLGTYVYKTAVSGTREGYPDFYNKCVEEKNAGEETQVTLGSTTITMYVNANGHQFYNIADKDAVDTWYNTYGIAWYYGVDEENERIFLPRKDLVSITPKDTLKIYGDGKGLLLTGVAPNGSIVGTNVAGNLCTTNSYNNSKPMYLGNGGQGNLGTTTTSTQATPIVGTGIRYGVPTETQLKNAGWSSGLKTGAFSTDTNTFIYMVVGNTKEVTHIRTTIPEGEALEQIYKNKDDITILNDNKVDLTNTQWAINSCALDYKNAISLTLTTTPYTAPIDGVIFVADNNTATKNQLIIDGVSLGAVKLYLSIAMRVSKGSTIATVANIHAQFIPLKGAV